MLMPAAFGFHSGVEAGPVLLGKIEAAQLNVDDCDAVIPQRHGVTPPSNLGDDGIRSVGCGSIETNATKPLLPIAAPSSADRMSPSLDSALLRSNDGFKKPLRIGHPPQDGAGCYDWRFLKGQEFGWWRSVDEQAMVERSDALQGILNPNPGAVITCVGLPKSVTIA